MYLSLLELLGQVSWLLGVSLFLGMLWILAYTNILRDSKEMRVTLMIISAALFLIGMWLVGYAQNAT